MPQIFSNRASNLFRLAMLTLLAMPLVVVAVAMLVVRSPWYTGVGQAVAQPVPFSHQHHVAGLGLDCRLCHQNVERSPVAGVPPTETCMVCHSQLWTEAEVLEPVRRSYASGEPLRWRRVHDLPDFVYFDHSVHVNNGVACQSCHGRVDRMPLVSQARHLTMGFCLDCHRNPAPQLRPPSGVFQMQSAPGPAADPQALLAHYDIADPYLADCSVCHR